MFFSVMPPSKKKKKPKTKPNKNKQKTPNTKNTKSNSMYVMNNSMDLHQKKTNTQEVVDVVSFQKQIIGRQVSAGVFSFLGTNFFDASVGESALEPIQLAVRSVVERGTMEMVSRAYGMGGGACAVSVDYLGGNPYGPNPYQQQAMAYQQPYAQAYAYQQPYAYQPTSYRPMENVNAFNRSNPYRGYAGDGSDSFLGLRPGY